jgi:hypothetical protein
MFHREGKRRKIQRQVLCPSYWSREAPEAAPEEYLDVDELLILRSATGKDVTTILQAVHAIAKLAGYPQLPKIPASGNQDGLVGTAPPQGHGGGAQDLQRRHKDMTHRKTSRGPQGLRGCLILGLSCDTSVKIKQKEQPRRQVLQRGELRGRSF